MLSTQDNVVHLGSWVEVQDGHLRESWRIVPAIDADAARQLISEETPLARAVIGHKPGDTVVVRVRGRAPWKVKILSVQTIG